MEIKSDISSTQVSFIIHKVQGEHLGAQNLVVSINGRDYILSPRNIKRGLRYYEGGYTIFIEPDQDVVFSVAVTTPNNNGKYFCHSFAQYKFRPFNDPVKQDVTLQTPGKSYEIFASVFTVPSNHLPMAAPRRSATTKFSSTIGTSTSRSQTRSSTRSSLRSSTLRSSALGTSSTLNK